MTWKSIFIGLIGAISGVLIVFLYCEQFMQQGENGAIKPKCFSSFGFSGFVRTGRTIVTNPHHTQLAFPLIRRTNPKQGQDELLLHGEVELSEGTVILNDFSMYPVASVICSNAGQNLLACAFSETADLEQSGEQSVFAVYVRDHSGKFVLTAKQGLTFIIDNMFFLPNSSSKVVIVPKIHLSFEDENKGYAGNGVVVDLDVETGLIAEITELPIKTKGFHAGNSSFSSASCVSIEGGKAAIGLPNGIPIVWDINTNSLPVESSSFSQCKGFNEPGDGLASVSLSPNGSMIATVVTKPLSKGSNLGDSALVQLRIFEVATGRVLHDESFEFDYKGYFWNTGIPVQFVSHKELIVLTPLSMKRMNLEQNTSKNLRFNESEHSNGQAISIQPLRASASEVSGQRFLVFWLRKIGDSHFMFVEPL